MTGAPAGTSDALRLVSYMESCTIWLPCLDHVGPDCWRALLLLHFSLLRRCELGAQVRRYIARCLLSPRQPASYNNRGAAPFVDSRWAISSHGPRWGPISMQCSVLDHGSSHGFGEHPQRCTVLVACVSVI